MALHAHFLPSQQYSRVYPLFLGFRALVYGCGCQFLSLSPEDNEHMKLIVLLFFQNPYAIFVHVLQHYHDFQSNVAIFPSVVQAYTQSDSFSGRIKLIICQIRHELFSIFTTTLDKFCTKLSEAEYNCQGYADNIALITKDKFQVILFDIFTRFLGKRRSAWV